jgi:hypothetical protein
MYISHENQALWNKWYEESKRNNPLVPRRRVKALTSRQIRHGYSVTEIPERPIPRELGRQWFDVGPDTERGGANE